MEEITARHKKEVKALEKSKREDLKKIKSTMGKGKKAKEALAKAEEEWKGKEEEMTARHKLELLSTTDAGRAPSPAEAPAEDPAVNVSATRAVEKEGSEEKVEPSPSLSKKEKALAKKRAKRQAELRKEKERDERIAKERLEAGPSSKELELRALQYPTDQFTIHEIPADGHCLYRAIAHQISSTYTHMRTMAADELANNRSQYEPFFFSEDETVTSYDQHIQQVRSTATWGGNMELRALANALHRPITVYSTNQPLTIPTSTSDDTPQQNQQPDDPIRLTYHRHYYALGEHYNSLIYK